MTALLIDVEHSPPTAGDGAGLLADLPYSV
jgi:hypothetical protein